MVFIYYCLFYATFFYFLRSIYKAPVKPTPYMLFFFSLYFFSTSLGERVLIYDNHLELKWVCYFLLVAGGLFTGELLSKKYRFGVEFNINEKTINKSIMLSLCIIGPLALYQFVNVFKYFVLNKSLSYGGVWEVTRSSVFFGSPMLMISLILIVCYYINRRGGVLLLLIPNVLLGFATGERGDLALVFLTLAVVFLKDKKNLFVYPLFMILLIALAGIYGNARAQMSGGLYHFSSSIVQRLIDNPSIVFEPFDINEFVNVGAPSKAAVLEGFDIEHPGANLINGVVKSVPFLGRYVSLTERTTGEMVQYLYYDELYSAKIVSGPGNLVIYGFDLYIAGGFLGLFIGVAFASFFINRLYICYLRGDLFKGVVFILSFSLVVLQVQRSTFQSSFVYLIKYHYFLVVIILVLWVIIRFLPRARQSEPYA